MSGTANDSTVLGKRTFLTMSGPPEETEEDQIKQLQKRLKMAEADVACMDRLRQDLTCPICLELCYCPFEFPCTVHTACHTCIVQLINNQSILTVDATGTDYARIARWKCPICNDSSTPRDIGSRCELQPAPLPIIKAVYGDTRNDYKCPYCETRGSMPWLCRQHLPSECTQVTINCGHCGVKVLFGREAMRRHLRHGCQTINCRQCSFWAPFDQFIKHHKLHRAWGRMNKSITYLQQRILDTKCLMPAGQEDLLLARTVRFQDDIFQFIADLVTIGAEASRVQPLQFIYYNLRSLVNSFDPATNSISSLPNSGGDEEGSSEDDFDN